MKTFEKINTANHNRQKTLKSNCCLQKERGKQRKRESPRAHIITSLYSRL